jgi:hypothetical protein
LAANLVRGPNWLPANLDATRTRLANCEKTCQLSFRGPGLPEESGFFLGVAEKQILRAAQDDNKK